jgi:hypothetical protein
VQTEIARNLPSLHLKFRGVYARAKELSALLGLAYFAAVFFAGYVAAILVYSLWPRRLCPPFPLRICDALPGRGTTQPIAFPIVYRHGVNLRRNCA